MQAATGFVASKRTAESTENAAESDATDIHSDSTETPNATTTGDVVTLFKD